MSEFRDSPFIDFTTGTVTVPPMELISRWGNRADLPLELQLTLFECRVDVWTLGPAVEMLKLIEATDRPDSAWSHAGYALLASTFTYFEMIGKILNSQSKPWKSKTDFNHGFCDVYPEYATNGDDRSDASLPPVAQLRDRVRNGLSHLGYTKTWVYIHHRPQQWPDDFTVVVQNGVPVYFVNPHTMTRTVVKHFPTLMERLRNQSPEFDGLREKFREFFVSFHEGEGG